MVKNLPAMRETWVQSMGWEDPLEKGMATHSSFLAWRIPRTLQSMGSKRVRLDSDFHFTSIHTYIELRSCSVVNSCLTLCDPLDCSPSSSGIFGPGICFRQEYWSGLPFPPSGDPNSGIEPVSPTLQVDS